jgi:hypothetical protein
MGEMVPIAWKRAMKDPALRYRAGRLAATGEAFDDEEKYQEILRRSAEPIDGENPWNGNVWAALLRLEEMIAEEIGWRPDHGVSEDDADPLFRWWNARMKAVFCTYYRDRDEDARRMTLAWAIEEARRQDGEAEMPNQWNVLALLEARVLDEIRREQDKRAGRGEGRA